MADADDEYEDTAVQDFLQILEEHRKNCERQGKYVEAEIAKNRLEELKLHEHNVKQPHPTLCRLEKERKGRSVRGALGLS